MADVEKTIRYKVEIDDQQAQLQLRQMATAGRLNVAAYAGAVAPGVTVQQTPVGTVQSAPPSAPGQYITPRQATVGTMGNVALGTYQAGSAVYGFGASIGHAIYSTPNYRDVLLPNGHYALDSSIKREVLSGVFGLGTASADTNTWGFQRGKPEWMTTEEYRSQLRESLGYRAKRFGYDAGEAVLDVAFWGLRDYGFISGPIASHFINTAKKQMEYRHEIEKNLRYSRTIGNRYSGLGFSPLAERQRENVASAIQAEDMGYWNTFFGRSPEFSLKKTMELADKSGINLNVESPEELVRKIKDIRQYVIKYAELMHTTRESVARIAGALSQIGVTSSTDIEQTLSTIRNTSAYTGVSTEKLLQQYSGGMNMAAGMGYNPVLGMQLMSSNMQFYQQMKDQGKLRPWEKPIDKAKGLTQGLMGLKNTPIGNALVLSTIDPQTGKIDMEKLKKIQSGELTVGQAFSGQFRGLSGNEMYSRLTELENAARSIDMSKPEIARAIAKAYEGIAKQSGLSGPAAAAFVSQQMGTPYRDVLNYLNNATFEQSKQNASTSATIQQARDEGHDVQVFKRDWSTGKITKNMVDEAEAGTRLGTPLDGASLGKFRAYYALEQNERELIKKTGYKDYSIAVKYLTGPGADVNFENYYRHVQEVAKKIKEADNVSDAEAMSRATLSSARFMKQLGGDEITGWRLHKVMGRKAESYIHPTGADEATNSALFKMFSKKSTEEDNRVAQIEKLKEIVQGFSPEKKANFLRYILLLKKETSNEKISRDEAIELTRLGEDNPEFEKLAGVAPGREEAANIIAVTGDWGRISAWSKNLGANTSETLSKDQYNLDGTKIPRRLYVPGLSQEAVGIVFGTDEKKIKRNDAIREHIGLAEKALRGKVSAKNMEVVATGLVNLLGGYETEGEFLEQNRKYFFNKNTAKKDIEEMEKNLTQARVAEGGKTGYAPGTPLDQQGVLGAIQASLLDFTSAIQELSAAITTTKMSG